MKLRQTLLVLLIFHILVQFSSALTDEEIKNIQPLLTNKPTGERIAFWAEKFINTPYDMDPRGEYVSKKTIVADERVDCMYLIFRATELALSHTAQEAIQIALEKRFHSKGIFKDGQVVNYNDRFEYGEDMIDSGKWGNEITREIGKTLTIKGSRSKDSVEVLSSDSFLKGGGELKSGDMIFFIKRVEERKIEEIVGHIGIIKIEKNTEGPNSGEVFLIHASGTKEKGGTVKKVLLKDYITKMPFIGVKITRFH
ncbi:MAG: hypothetical protein A2169_08770 [Deltaproteobacteria bacterium RBG_13_47_9]|nr:MAG: hypothetical protein A2169_08770 [Deltaproteobacteria bacterium RBG_13_47_9]